MEFFCVQFHIIIFSNQHTARAIYKSQNEETGKGIMRMMGMRGLRVGMMGMRGISMGMRSLKVRIRGIRGGNEGNQGENLHIGVEMMS